MDNFFFQSRKWPDLNLKSPGIKPRTLAGRSHPPQPLPAVTPHLVPPASSPRPFSDDGGGEETPRTPLTAPHTPPPGHLGDYSVFAQIHIGPSKKFYKYRFHLLTTHKIEVLMHLSL